MIELLQSYGFSQTGICNCDGHATHKFTKGLFEVRWRINRNQFKLKNNNRAITGWLPINEANEVFKKYFQPQAETVPA